MKTINESTSNKIIFFCWMISMISMMGSLFFSEVMLFPPCALCWYQRIAMYPLVLIFGVGFFEKTKSTIHFSLPVVIVGWIISVYHNLLHYGIVPESAAPCREGVSCSTVYVNWFGFITIPMLSFIGFSIMLFALILLNRRVTSEK